jgi:parallel beta-helix repeat protein
MLLAVLPKAAFAYDDKGSYFECHNCSDCRDALNNNTYFEVHLVEDITDQAGSCIDNPANFSNKTFDCLGHTIDGAGTDFGIYLNGKTNNTIKNCIITEFYHGISLDSSSDNTIINNTANNNSEGIYFDSSSNNTLVNNNAINNSDTGIYLYSSSNNTITNNTANNNNYGIYLTSSSDNTIINNTANNNQYEGIYFDSSSNNTLVNNNAINNSDTGIYLYSSSDNTIINNTANNNGEGISLDSSSSNTIINNTANNNDQYGIYFEFSSHNTLINSVANNNGQRGIFIDYSLGNNLTNNTANYNGENGIYFYSSTENILINNIVNGNGEKGCYLSSSSDNNTLINNTVNNNTAEGIYLYDSSYNTLMDNTANNNDIGVYVYSASNITFIGNTFDTNNHGIYLDTNSFNTALINNTATNNSIFDFSCDSECSAVNLNIGFPVSLDGTNFNLKKGASLGNDLERGVRYLNITNSSATNAWVFINISYPENEDASKLFLARWNNSAWETDVSNFANVYGINTAEKYYYANITNFSLFVLFAEQAPTISLELSSSNIYLGNSITVSCSATDGSGVASVTVTSSDGTSICSGASSCSGEYKPTSSGTKIITCRATDTRGNIGESSKELTVHLLTRNRTSLSQTPPSPPPEQPQQPPQPQQQCPTCPSCGPWSDCLGGEQIRTCFVCSAATNYTCAESIEKRACNVTQPSENATPITNTIAAVQSAANMISAQPQLSPFMPAGSVVLQPAMELLKIISAIIERPVTCGNGTCDANENVYNCSLDCHSPEDLSPVVSALVLLVIVSGWALKQRALRRARARAVLKKLKAHEKEE